MDDTTREAVSDILRSALERTRRAAGSLEPDTPAVRELGIAQRLIESALQAVSGETVDSINSAAADGDAIHDRNRAQEPLPPLTLREVEVLHLMAEGLRNKEIAARLGISERTATFHVGNCLSKLGADGRVEAITIGRRHGLL
ncbi:MAG TPA: LuxR C-terminal-related transcriptional regulator [Anaerolineae bacterium]|jgi:DNA-binding CsgD family transcriptional regulator